MALAQAAKPAPTFAAPRFIVGVVGSFRILDEARNAADLPRGRKSRALIAHLALSPRHRVSRERLIGLLWSRRDPEQGRASLRQSLAEIRKCEIGSPDTVLISRQEIALAEGLFVTDLDRAGAAIEACDLGALAAELEAMDTGFLDDFDGVDPGFDQWLRGERARHRGRLVEQSLALVAGLGAPETLALRRAIATSLQRVDGADESIVRLGLALDGEAGDMAAVHRRYRSFENRLRQDFDAPPSEDTQRLFRRLTTVAAVVSPEPSAEAPGRAPRPGRRAGEPPILVISPLTVIGEDAEAAVLATICRDELEIALGGIGDLRVLSLANPAPGGALEAACSGSIASYTLNGTIRRMGEEYRLNLRLLAITSSLLVWSRQVSIRRDELGGALDDIVARVAGAMLPVVERDLDRALDGSTELTGYALYLQARSRQLTASSLADVGEAARLFEQAIEHDPRLTNAQLVLARLYNTDFEQRMAGHDVAPLRARAFALCAEAAARDPGNPHVHTRLGWCHLRHGDDRHAQQRFEEALRLAPYHAARLEEAATGLYHLGMPERAIALIRRAFELNPFSPDDYFADLGIALMLTGQHARAEEQFEISSEHAIHYRAAHIANRALLERGPPDEARIVTLRADFEVIWQRRDPPRDHDLAETMLEFLPLRREQDRALFLRGLRAAGLRF